MYDLTGRAQKILRGTILLEPTHEKKYEQSNNFEKKEKLGKGRGSGDFKTCYSHRELQRRLKEK